MSGRVIGIDLGTSNSVVASMVNGVPLVIPDHEGQTTIPSVVSFLPDGHVVVGRKAKARVVTDPMNTIHSAKRLIGRPFNAPQVLQFMAHHAMAVEEGRDRNPKFVAQTRAYAIEEVQAIILRKMKTIAEAYFGEVIEQAVISVPANFNEGQRYATKVAGELAGLEVLRIVNEPTAAALAYGYGQNKHERVAVYDFGGGTFDVTILDLRDEVFEVLSTAGNTYLGGNDIDDRLAANLAEALYARFGVDVTENPAIMQRLRTIAERIKCELSRRQHLQMELSERLPGQSEPATLPFHISRAEFNRKIRDIVQQTFVVCDEALKLAGLAAQKIDHVILVGGTTQIPLVKEMVAQYFGMTPREDIDVHEVVAVGAGIYADSLSQQASGVEPSSPRALLIDVTPHSLGIETFGNLMDTIIERNTNIPAQRTRTFTTTSDNQKAVRIHIYEGEGRTTATNSKLGELVLTGLREAPRGEVRVDVTFQIDTDGMLGVTATDRSTGAKQACSLNIAGGLSKDEIARLKMGHLQGG